jgi:hypothetical protein
VCGGYPRSKFEHLFSTRSGSKRHELVYWEIKITLPEQTHIYAELVEHPRVLKAVALSGGLFAARRQ